MSEAKSRVFFSPNVDPDKREALTNMLGFNSTTNLGKYLGFPIKHLGRQRHNFDFILDRVKKKLAGWKTSKFENFHPQPFLAMLCRVIF